MKKIGPIFSIFMLVLGLVALALSIYLKAKGIINWGEAAGCLVSTTFLAVFFAAMVWLDFVRKWWI